MILCAHQPQFMPWLGFFDKWRSCDLFVLLDSVQYKKNEWQNRNRILTPQGPLWLTVPVAFRFGESIRQARVDDKTDWRRKHLRALSQSYSRSPGFADLMPALERMYARGFETLAQVNTASLDLLSPRLGVKTPRVLLSDNEVEGAASLRLVNLCRKFGAQAYLAGAGGRGYMDLALFERAGIRVIFQEYRHPVYPQPGPAFTPFLSALDLLFRAGKGAAGMY